MDTRTSSSTPPPALSTSTRRKRRNGDDGGVRRYFLPKSGSSPATPELDQEVPSEGEALIQAFRSGQPFYTLTAWKAVPEVNGGGSPMIVKQAVAPKQVQS
jgi:hypothetical protein